MALKIPTTKKIVIDITTSKDEKEITKALKSLVENLSHENLLVIAEKSKTQGINQKIQTFKSFL